MNRINLDDSVRNRADERPTKQPRLEESERSKVVGGVEGELAKPRQRGIITEEELDKMKFRVCAICGIADDHPMSFCPLRNGCPSTTSVGPDAEIYCLCCDEDVTIAHPNQYIIAKARLKESFFDCIRILPPRSQLPKGAFVK